MELTKVGLNYSRAGNLNQEKDKNSKQVEIAHLIMILDLGNW